MRDLNARTTLILVLDLVLCPLFCLPKSIANIDNHNNNYDNDIAQLKRISRNSLSKNVIDYLANFGYLPQSETEALMTENQVIITIKRYHADNIERLRNNFLKSVQNLKIFP